MRFFSRSVWVWRAAAVSRAVGCWRPGGGGRVAAAPAGRQARWLRAARWAAAAGRREGCRRRSTARSTCATCHSAPARTRSTVRDARALAAGVLAGRGVELVRVRACLPRGGCLVGGMALRPERRALRAAVVPRRDGWYEGVEGGGEGNWDVGGWCVLGLEGLLGDGDLSLLRAHSLLADIFGKYGAIRQVRLGCEKDTRGRAYVVFEDIHDAKNACDHLSGYSVGNRYLIVSYHQPSKQLKVTFFVCGGGSGACGVLVRVWFCLEGGVPLVLFVGWFASFGLMIFLFLHQAQEAQHKEAEVADLRRMADEAQRRAG